LPLEKRTGLDNCSDVDRLIERLVREGKAAVNEIEKELGDQPTFDRSKPQTRARRSHHRKKEDAGLGDMSDNAECGFFMQ